jgi:hypothetical protein
MFECRQEIAHSPNSQAAGRPDHLLKFPSLEEIITTATFENLRVQVATSSRFPILHERLVHVLANLVKRTRRKHENL